MMKKFIVLLKGDLKNIARDKMLLFILLAPFLMGIVFKYVISFLEVILLNEFSFHLSSYYFLLFIFIIILIPMVSGILAAFLILEDRDQGILAYLSITPLSKNGYLLYRLLISFIISFISVIFAYYILQIIQVKVLFLLAVLMMTALGGPLLVLLITAYADNKVEGFAFAKGAGVLYLLPFTAYFIDSILRYLFAIFPSFWVYKSFQAIDNDSTIYLLYILFGLLVHLFFISFLLKKFKNRYN